MTDPHHVDSEVRSNTGWQTWYRGTDVRAAGAAARGGPDVARLFESFRRLQDRFVGAVVPDHIEQELIDDIDALSEKLGQYGVPERERVDGRRSDLPGRGSTLLPPYLITETTADTLIGSVEFSRFHLGANGAVHGGIPALMFDDVLGQVANRGVIEIARTAYLKIDYRIVTPVNVPLLISATLDRVDGRKRWVSGRLTDDCGAVLCEAEGLWLTLRPGQL